MRPVVLDVMDLGVESIIDGAHLLGQTAELAEILKLSSDTIQVVRFSQREKNLLNKMSARFSRDRYVRDVAGPDVRFSKNSVNRTLRKTRPMFDAVETLFFDACDEISVLEQGCGRIRMKRVEAEDQSHEQPFATSLS